MSNFTPKQREVIETVKTNLIVSAGAGSGKTTTLTQRVIDIIKSGVSINNLLVLTFTKAASNEMKEKIREALKKESSLQEELNYLDSSYITTFDSFALSIVKKYYYKKNLESNIGITDQTLVNVNVNHLVRNVLDKHYKENDLDFLKMVDEIIIKNDQKIIDIVLNINNELDKKVDKEEFINNYNKNYFNNHNFINQILNDYNNVITELLYNYKISLDDLSNYCEEKVSDKLEEYINSVKSLKTYEDIYSFFNDKNKKLPSYSEKSCDILYKVKKAEITKTVLESIKKTLIYEDLSSYKDAIDLMKPYSKVILNLVKELDIEINNFKRINDIFTFNDISRLAINILEENEEVRLELKNKFKEIMIDEYQDTSDIQERLINLISNNNVCMVGDIKQSIYRFRNANPSIFKDKYNSYAKSESDKKIDLLENFRSREEVVSDVNTIFSSCMTEEIGGANYKKEHLMIFGNKTYDKFKANQDYHMDILNYNAFYEFNKNNGKKYTSDEMEAFIIGWDIKNKIENNFQVFNFKEENKNLRKANYSDFCILISFKSSFEVYRDIFEYLQIPLNVLKDENLVEGDELLTLKNILKLVLSIKNNTFNQDNKDTIYQVVSIARSFLFEMDDEQIFDIINLKRIKETEIYLKAKKISYDLSVLSLQEIIELVINEFDFINKFNKKASINKMIIESEYLISTASSFKMDLDEYISYLDEVYDKQMKIDFEAGAVVNDAVQIMSIHRSKGLEFQVCYYAGLYKKFNKRDTKSKFLFNDHLGLITPYYNFGLHETYLKNLYKYYFDIDEISERIRLFYVAITRAKEKVIILDNIIEDNIKDGYKSVYELMNIDSFSKLMHGIYGLIPNRIINLDTNEVKISKAYLYKERSSREIEKNVSLIKVNPLEIKPVEEKTISFSKKSYKIIAKETKEKMEFGEKIHYILEILDFKSDNLFNDIDSLDIDSFYKDRIKKFFNSDFMKDRNKANIYKEYQFIYNNSKGIIDLIMEYDDHIDIIDYKLKNIIDDEYVKQLTSYYEVIKLKTNKEIRLHLYSILNSDILNV